MSCKGCQNKENKPIQKPMKNAKDPLITIRHSRTGRENKISESMWNRLSVDPKGGTRGNGKAQAPRRIRPRFL